MRSRWLFKNSDQNFRISWIFETKVKVVNFLFWVFKNKISIVNFLFSWQMTMGQWPTMRFVPSWRSNELFLRIWKYWHWLQGWLLWCWDWCVLWYVRRQWRRDNLNRCELTHVINQYCNLHLFINHSSLTGHYTILNIKWI